MTGMDLEQVSEIIRGPEDSAIQLDLRRGRDELMGSEVFSVQLVRQFGTLPSPAPGSCSVWSEHISDAALRASGRGHPSRPLSYRQSASHAAHSTTFSTRQQSQLALSFPRSPLPFATLTPISGERSPLSSESMSAGAKSLSPGINGREMVSQDLASAQAGEEDLGVGLESSKSSTGDLARKSTSNLPDWPEAATLLRTMTRPRSSALLLPTRD